MRIVERAVVLSVEGGRARVEVPRPAGAGGEGGAGCGGCSAAGSCSSAEGGGGRRLTVDGYPGVKAGDEVTLVIEGPSPALAALIILFLPFGLGVASGLAAYAASASTAVGLLAGAGGVTALYLALYATRSRHAGRVEISPADRGDPK